MHAPPCHSASAPSELLPASVAATRQPASLADLNPNPSYRRDLNPNGAVNWDPSATPDSSFTSKQLTFFDSAPTPPLSTLTSLAGSSSTAVGNATGAQAFEVVIEKSIDEGFGIGFGEHPAGGLPVITELIPHGAAKRTGVLRLLDRVHAINGMPVGVDGSIEETLPRISKSSSTLTLLVSPQPNVSADEGVDEKVAVATETATRGEAAVFELTLTREPTEGFGLGVGFEEGRVVLSSIAADSP